MFRRFRTKVGEQGLRTTVKEAGPGKLLAVAILASVCLVLYLSTPCSKSEAATIHALEQLVEQLEAKVTAITVHHEPASPGLSSESSRHGGQSAHDSPADHFEEQAEEDQQDDNEQDDNEQDDESIGDEDLVDTSGGARLVEPPDISKVKRSEPRPDGRVELEPINMGCYIVTDPAECCKKLDSRWTIHGPPYFGGIPCLPSAPGTKFKTKNVCEPETYAETEDIDVQGSCDPEDTTGVIETLEEVIARQKVDAKGKRRKEDAHDLNLMWVTDCQPQMEWSSALLLWSALNVKQPGDFTRIATGCESPKRRRFVIDSMNTIADVFGVRERVTVHFAPKHITDARDGTDGEVYTPYTKAFGVKHFLDHDRPHSRVGVILDPDFVFNRPLEYKIDQLLEKDVILPAPTEAAGDWKHDVLPGRPVGQLYGLGNGWLEYDRETICGKGSPCTRVSPEDATKYFTMGPPIFMTIGDWIKVAQGWYDFLPIIRRTGKDWMEEMRSYTMSAAHIEQKTAIFQHFMLSDICREGKALNTANYPDLDLVSNPYPPILHYCGAYEPEYYDWHYFWSKYQVNMGAAQLGGGNILDCDQPLYEDPPRDLLEAQLPFGAKEDCLSQRRQAWALCQIQFTLNDMLVAFKTQKCGDKWNKERVAYHTFDPRPSEIDHPKHCRKERPKERPKKSKKPIFIH